MLRKILSMGSANGISTRLAIPPYNRLMAAAFQPHIAASSVSPRPSALPTSVVAANAIPKAGSIAVI